MGQYLEFWWAKIVAELLFTAAVFGVMFAVAIIAVLYAVTKQHFCKHAEYSEVWPCNAKCKKCGKILGHISHVRKERENVKRN